MNFADEIKRTFRSGTTLTRLILINVAFFVVIKLIGVFIFLMQQPDLHHDMIGFLGLPADVGTLA